FSVISHDETPTQSWFYQTFLWRRRRISPRPASAALKMARLAGSGTGLEINPMLVFTVCATSPLVAHPALLPVPARQSNAKMKDPGPAVVSIVIGDPEVKLVG